MLHEMMKKEDLNDISKYGKAYGAFLLHCLLHDICDINNFFVFDSMEEFPDNTKKHSRAVMTNNRFPNFLFI